MRKNQSKRGFLRQAGLTSQSHQVLPLIVNAKHISNRKQNIKLFDCTTTVRPIPVAPKPVNIVKAKTTLAQPIYKSSFYNNYNNQQQQSKELLPNRSKSMQYFKDELRKLEDEQARLRKEHEEQMNKDQVNDIKGLERSKTSIELGTLPYTPTFACQLDKRQRFEIYKRRLNIKPAAKTSEEAIEMINKTMDEIEDKYAPKKDDKLYPIYSKRYGRMVNLILVFK